MAGNGFNKVRTTAAAAIVVVSLSAPATAFAADAVISASVNSVEVPRVTPSEVLGEVATPTTLAAAPAANQPTEVLAESVEAGGLAATGSDIAGLALIGIGAVGAGLLFLSARRRRAEA